MYFFEPFQYFVGNVAANVQVRQQAHFFTEEVIFLKSSCLTCQGLRKYPLHLHNSNHIYSMSVKKRILVAEDSSVIQNITKKVLQGQNYEIDFAKNGKQVIKMMEKNDYDAILMDITMPVMDGIECTKQIRGMKDPGKASVPIIAVTGNAQNLSEADYKSVGINAYIPKPLNYDLLIKTVGGLVG